MTRSGGEVETIGLNKWSAYVQVKRFVPMLGLYGAFRVYIDHFCGFSISQIAVAKVSRSWQISERRTHRCE